MPASLTADGRRLGVRVHNLSSGGAMIELAEPLQSGTRVRLDCGLIEVEGVVIWHRAQRFGIRFLTPIDEAQVARQMGRSKAIAPYPGGIPHKT